MQAMVFDHRKRLSKMRKITKNTKSIYESQFQGINRSPPLARGVFNEASCGSKNANDSAARRPRCSVIEGRDLASSSGNVGVSQRDHPRLWAEKKIGDSRSTWRCHEGAWRFVTRCLSLDPWFCFHSIFPSFLVIRCCTGGNSIIISRD